MNSDRMHIGVSHEMNVMQKLQRHGWAVQKWGQGLLDDEIRTALVAYKPKAMWRWLPDLIAVHGRRIFLVDAKTDQSTTPNFSLEVDAYMAHKAMRALGLPLVYVWQDMTTNTPEGLDVVRWVLEPQRGLNAGSGTPFLLVRKADQHPFEWAFGEPVERAA